MLKKNLETLIKAYESYATTTTSDGSRSGDAYMVFLDLADDFGGRDGLDYNRIWALKNIIISCIDLGKESLIEETLLKIAGIKAE